MKIIIHPSLKILLAVVGSLSIHHKNVLKPRWWVKSLEEGCGEENLCQCSISSTHTLDWHWRSIISIYRLSDSYLLSQIIAMENVEAAATTLQYVKLTPNAFPPTRGSSMAAGFDVKSAYCVTITALGKSLVETDLAIRVPSGCYGRIAPRSGLAVHHHISVGGGVIDADYCGNVCVILFNYSVTPFHVRRGDRIAQLICERIVYPNICEVQELDATERDPGGFGSTERN
jgi:dUTP pyrophosphatase